MIIGFLGLVVAAVYVGYLAYAIEAVPLWIIIVATFALAIREFIVEFGNGGKGR